MNGNAPGEAFEFPIVVDRCGRYHSSIMPLTVMEEDAGFYVEVAPNDEFAFQEFASKNSVGTVRLSISEPDEEPEPSQAEEPYKRLADIQTASEPPPPPAPAPPIKYRLVRSGGSLDELQSIFDRFAPRPRA